MSDTAITTRKITVALRDAATTEVLDVANLDAGSEVYVTKIRSETAVIRVPGTLWGQTVFLDALRFAF